jgi:hypothetical protein
MFYKTAADLVVLLHLLFIVYVLLGGFLVLIHRAWSIVHLPAVAWAAMIEFKGWICPLTPLENWLRRKGGHEIYQEGFVEHYLMPVIYPSGLTRKTQIVLGMIVIVANACIYLWVLYSTRSIGCSVPRKEIL